LAGVQGQVRHRIKTEQFRTVTFLDQRQSHGNFIDQHFKCRDEMRLTELCGSDTFVAIFKITSQDGRCANRFGEELIKIPLMGSDYI
jgi:hypothetical protein